MDQAILADLRHAYDSGNLIVFVGAGTSTAAGLPTWTKLAQRLLERVRGAGKEAPAIEEIEDLIQSGQLIDALSAAKHALGDEEFNREVERALDPKDAALPSVLRAIADLKPKLWAVLTTNLDRLLERAFAGDWEDFEDPPGDVASRRHYILKLHGTLGKHKTWVFSRDQYDRAMFGRPQLQNTFGALYLTHPILFVGFGLADENIDLTLGKVRALSEGQPPSHYALMPESSVGPSRRRKLEAAGVRLLLYKNEDGKHAEVEQVLRSLASEAKPPLASVPDLAPSTLASRLPPTSADPEASAVSVGPVRVFVSCAPEDNDLLVKLEKHLNRLVKERRIDLWHEGKLGAGDERKPAIDVHLMQADLILLLLSSDYLASDHNEVEMTQALERQRVDSVNVIPILLRACAWKQTELRVKRPWPSPARRGEDPDDPTPLASRAPHEQEAALTQIATDLRTLVDKLRPSR